MESNGVTGRQKEIEQRLRNGEKATYIANETGLPRPQIVRIAKEAGIVLKRGRQRIVDNPDLYGKYIDDKFGAGTADNIRRWRERLTYADIGQALGGMSRGSAHHIGKHLAGRAPKPAVPHKPVKWQRADITTEHVRECAKRCLSVVAIARELHASGHVVYRRAMDGDIHLPNGHLNMARIMPDRRPDITRKRMCRLAKKLPTLSAMAIALRTDINTVKRRAKRFDVSLPKYREAKRVL